MAKKKRILAAITDERLPGSLTVVLGDQYRIQNVTPEGFLERINSGKVADYDFLLLSDDLFDRVSGQVEGRLPPLLVFATTLDCAWRVSLAGHSFLPLDRIASQLLPTLEMISGRSEPGEQTMNSTVGVLSHIGELFPFFMYIHDIVENRNVFTNRSLATMLGYTTREIMEMGGELLPTILHPEDAGRFANLKKRFIDSPDVCHENVLRLKGTKGWRWMYAREVVLDRDREGMPRRIIGFLDDITEERATLQALARAEETYRTLTNRVSDIFFGMDRDLKYTYWNAASEKFSNISAEEALGKKLTEIFPNAAGAELEQVYRSALDAGRPMQVFNSWEQEGTTNWFELDIYPDDEGLSVLARNVTAQKSMESLLRAAEERQRNLVENLPVPVLISRFGDGLILFANSHAADVLGFRENEMVGLGTPGLYQDLAERSALLEALRLDARIYNREIRVVRKDRSFTTVRVSASLMSYDGQDAILCVFDEVSWRKRLEEELARFRSVVDRVQESLFVVNADTGAIVDVNETACRMLKSERNELLQCRLQELQCDFATGDSDRFDRAVQRARSEGDFVVKSEWKRAEGRFPVEIWIALRVFSGKNYLVLMVKDISESEKSRSELQRQAMALAAAAECIFITDPEGIIQYVNPAFVHMTGYAVEEALGNRPGMLKSGQMNERFYQRLWRIIKSGQVWQGRVINRRKDGTLFEVEGTVSPMVNEAGTILYYVAVYRDVTEIRALQRHLEQTQKMEAIGNLAGGIAHDFNNILTGIVLNAEMVEEDAARPDAVRKGTGEILAASLRARDLIRQILTFSRQGEANRERVNPGIIAREVIRLMRTSLPASAEIRSNYEFENFYVEADPAQIHQILMNLCTNAAWAIRDSSAGVLEIRMERTFVDHKFIANFPDLVPGYFIQVSVSDNGVGMSAATQERVFEPFYSTRTASGGTGLGLAVVHGIVKSLNGFLSVDSKPGEGSGFHVFLPEMRESPPGTLSAEETREFSRGSILFVDDEPALLKALGGYLRSIGYCITEAGTAEEAMELYRQRGGAFDLLITDQSMPGMTGLNLVEKIRAEKPGLPVLLLTGFADEVLEQKAKAIGVQNIVLKPFTRSEISSVIQTLVNHVQV